MAQGFADEAVKGLRERGLVYGYPDGDLRLSQYITRAEAFLLLWRTILSYRLDDLKALTPEELEKLKGLIKSVEELSRKLEEEANLRLDLSEKLKDLEGKREEVEGLKARVSALEDTAYKGLSGLKDEVSALSGYLKELADRISALEKKGEEEKPFPVEALQAQLSAFEGKLASLEAIRKELEGLRKEVQDLETRLSSLEEEMIGLRKLEGRVEALERRALPPQWGVGLYLAGVNPIQGFLDVQYRLQGGLYAGLTGGQDPLGFRAGPALFGLLERDGVGLSLGLAYLFRFSGLPGYGEARFGLEVPVYGPFRFGLSASLAYPMGQGPSVALFGFGGVVRW